MNKFKQVWTRYVAVLVCKNELGRSVYWEFWVVFLVFESQVSGLNLVKYGMSCQSCKTWRLPFQYEVREATVGLKVVYSGPERGGCAATWRRLRGDCTRQSQAARRCLPAGSSSVSVYVQVVSALRQRAALCWEQASTSMLLRTFPPSPKGSCRVSTRWVRWN